MLDTNGLWIAADRIFDGLEGERDVVAQAHAAVFVFDFEIERDVLRIEELGNGFGNDLERHSAFLAGRNFHQRFALLWVGFLFDEKSERSVALVQRAGPMRDEAKRQTVQ